LPSGWAIETTEVGPDDADRVATDPTKPAQVYLGEELVITGYVDTYTAEYDAGEHQVNVQGRSKTEDLVDCSLFPDEKEGWSIYAATLREAAERVCKPFGIEVSLPDGNPEIDKTVVFPIHLGMTCAQMLAHLANATQTLMWDDPQGRLVFSKVGTKRAATALIEGENCEVGRSRISAAEAYSDVIVAGQMPNPFFDDAQKTYLNELGRSDRDAKLGRYRPHAVAVDSIGRDPHWPKDYANWTIARQYGRGHIVEVTVTGWRDGAGALWTPNTVVNVICPRLKMQQDLVIAQARWIRSENGTQTVLTCMPPEGLKPPPFRFNWPEIETVGDGRTQERHF
jgi:prophage tail gpP-like protein